MAAKKNISTMDALVAYMKKHPKAVFADARDALAKGKHKIYPIMWGRAQVLLGRVKAKKRGSKKAAAKAPAGKAPVVKAKRKTASRGTGRPVGRPRKTAGDIVIDAADLNRWQTLVSHLNGGGKVALQFDGSEWVLTSK